MDTHPIAAIVLAAGKSTRFRSATSKLIHPLAGRPLIHWTLSSLRGLGASPIVVVVGADADGVRAVCGNDVVFAHQPVQHGTGHATLAAQPALMNAPGLVIVLYGDLPLLEAASLARMVAAHGDTHADLTLLTAIVADSHGWGRIVRQGDHVTAIVEDRDATPEIKAIREVNVGIYCLAPTLLFRLLGRVRPDNAQHEIYLTDIVGLAVGDGLRISDVSIAAEEVGQINSRAELAAIERIVRRRTNTKWMAAGVTLEDPDNTYIDVDVEIGPDTVIGPNVHLRGKTVIGERCRFDGNAFVTNTTIGDVVHVKYAVVMTESTVGRECEIGPFAQLRPRTRLANNVHIGDFVETKNAIISQRTKANHLAYLGDVEIGEDANIGAGTITCNYDGFGKHRTVIGDRVQVGSDSQLIAPVTLAADSYVATGTTVRDDVPAGALVFNRKNQVHRPGWVQAFRSRRNTTDGSDSARVRGSKSAKPRGLKKRKVVAPRKSGGTPRKTAAGRINRKTRGKKGRGR